MPSVSIDSSLVRVTFSVFDFLSKLSSFLLLQTGQLSLPAGPVLLRLTLVVSPSALLFEAPLECSRVKRKKSLIQGGRMSHSQNFTAGDEGLRPNCG